MKNTDMVRCCQVQHGLRYTDMVRCCQVQHGLSYTEVAMAINRRYHVQRGFNQNRNGLSQYGYMVTEVLMALVLPPGVVTYGYHMPLAQLLCGHYLRSPASVRYSFVRGPDEGLTAGIARHSVFAFFIFLFFFYIRGLGEQDMSCHRIVTTRTAVPFVLFTFSHWFSFAWACLGVIDVEGHAAHCRVANGKYTYSIYYHLVIHLAIHAVAPTHLRPPPTPPILFPAQFVQTPQLQSESARVINTSKQLISRHYLSSHP